MTRLLIEAALAFLAVPVVLASGYLLVLTLLSRRLPVPSPPEHSVRFDVVVPAHDEETGVATTVTSLLAVDYPATLRRVVVIADNCTDRTADRAREAGAVVLVRQDPVRRGKGYALAHAFTWSRVDGFADAVVVVDADTTVPRNLLHAFAARLARGANAVQADYGVGNPRASWRSCLTAIGFALVDTLRMLGRERLGCSAGLRGNGMCFSGRALQEVPYGAFSVVEDVEYGIALGRAGHRVHYAAEATVRSDMPVGADAAAVQRQRWEGGRLVLAIREAPALVWRGLRERDRILLDLGADLLVPPLAYLSAVAAAGAVLSVLAGALLGRPLPVTWAFLASLAALSAYVARGWALSRTGLTGLRALAFTPVYLVWKIGLVVRGRWRSGEKWVRTPRERSP